MGPCLAFLKQNNHLSAINESSSEVSTGICKRRLVRASISNTVSITIKTNLQNEPESRFKGPDRGRLSCPGITNQIMGWAVINGLICAGHRHRRLRHIVAGRSRLQDRFPVLDRRAQADERQAVPDLPDLPRAIHGVLRDRAAPDLRNLRDLGCGGRRDHAGGVSSQQDGRKVHNALAFARAFAVL